MNEKNPYKVPEGYFNSLQQKILQQTVHSGVQPTKAIVVEHIARPRNSALKSMLGFAAGFAIFVALAWGGFYTIMGEDMSVEQSTLTADEEVLWGGSERFIDIIIEDEESYYALLADEVVDYIDFWGVGNTEIVLDFEE